MDDKILGLQSGADDYLPNLFTFPNWLKWVTIIRKSLKGKRLRFDNLQLDLMEKPL
jgi:DNA-binding response OmpR family regulator